MSFWDLYQEMDAALQSDPEIQTTLIEEFCNGSSSRSINKLKVFHTFFLKSKSGNPSIEQLKAVATVTLSRLSTFSELESTEESVLNLQILCMTVKLLPMDGLWEIAETVKSITNSKSFIQMIVIKHLKSDFIKLSAKLTTSTDLDELRVEVQEFLEYVRIPLILFKERLHKTIYLNEILTWFQFFFNLSNPKIANQTIVFHSWKYLILNIACDVGYFIRKLDLVLIPIWNYAKFSKSLLSLPCDAASSDEDGVSMTNSFLYVLKILAFAHSSTSPKPLELDIITKLVAPVLSSNSRVFQSNIVHLLIPFFCNTTSATLQPLETFQTLSDTWTSITTTNFQPLIHPPSKWRPTQFQTINSLFKKYVTSLDGSEQMDADTCIILSSLLDHISTSLSDNEKQACLQDILDTLSLISETPLFAKICKLVSDSTEKSIIDQFIAIQKPTGVLEKVSQPQAPHFKEWSQGKIDERFYLSSIVQTSEIDKENVPATSPFSVLSKKVNAVKKRRFEEVCVEEKDEDLVVVVERAVGLSNQVDDLSRTDLTLLQSHLSSIMGRVCKRLL